MALYRSSDYQTSLSQMAFLFTRKSSISIFKMVPSWISNQDDFSYFWSTSHLDTSNEIWVNCPFGSGEKV